MFIELTNKTTDSPMLVNTLNIETIMPLEKGEGCDLWSVDDIYKVKETYDEIKSKLQDAGELREFIPPEDDLHIF